MPLTQDSRRESCAPALTSLGVKANRNDSLEGESQGRGFRSWLRSWPHTPNFRKSLLQEYNTPGRQTNLTYMALACFSARSPITGSVYITPWLAFISRMIHTMRKPTQRPAQIRNEIKCPKIGMNAKTMDTINRPIQSTTAARCKNRFCQEWKRTNRLLLYGSVT